MQRSGEFFGCFTMQQHDCRMIKIGTTHNPTLDCNITDTRTPLSAGGVGFVTQLFIGQAFELLCK
jgi:hypothetical protein